MRYELVIKPAAELDLLESAKWYESQKEQLGSRFIEAVENKLHDISRAPLHYQIRYKNTRLALVNRFPYAIHFQVNKDKIFVLAVLSTSRNPLDWKSN